MHFHVLNFQHDKTGEATTTTPFLPMTSWFYFLSRVRPILLRLRYMQEENILPTCVKGIVDPKVDIKKPNFSLVMSLHVFLCYSRISFTFGFLHFSFQYYWVLHSSFCLLIFSLLLWITPSSSFLGALPFVMLTHPFPFFLLLWWTW